MVVVQRIVASCLLVFAVLQINDADGWIWTPIYLLPAWMLWFPSQKPAARWSIGTAILVYLAGAWWLWPAEFRGVATMNADVPQIELARESLGLLICSGGFLLSLLVREPQ